MFQDLLESIKAWNYLRQEKKLYRLLEKLSGEDGAVAYAKTELAVSLGPEADEMDQWMATHLIRMVRLFDLEGHSGFSAAVAVNMLKRLLRFKPLGPLTGEEHEWMIHEDEGGYTQTQNKRCTSVFMREDGTAYDNNGKVFREPDGACFTSSDSRVEITFPYDPKTEYVDIPFDRE